MEEVYTLSFTDERGKIEAQMSLVSINFILFKLFVYSAL